MTVTRQNAAKMLGLDDLRNLLFLPIEVNSIAAQVSRIIYTGSATFRIPKMTTEPSAAFVAEGAEITPSDPVVDEVAVTPSKCAGLTIVTNEMIADSQNTAAAEQIGEGLARDIARKTDAAFFGTTTPNGPSGLGSLTGTVAVAQVATISNADAFTEGVFSAADKDANITHWIVNPAEAKDLAKVKESGTSARGLLQPDPTRAGARTIEGRQVLVSKHVAPKTMWGVDATQVLFVIREDADITTDSSVAFTSDRTAVRAIARLGFGFLNPAGVVKITRA